MNDVIKETVAAVRRRRAGRERHKANHIVSVITTKRYSYEIHDVTITHRQSGQRYHIDVLPLDGWLWHGTGWVKIPNIGLRYVQANLPPCPKLIMPGTNLAIEGTVVRVPRKPQSYTRQVIQAVEINE